MVFLELLLTQWKKTGQASSVPIPEVSKIPRMSGKAHAGPCSTTECGKHPVNRVRLTRVKAVHFLVAYGEDTYHIPMGLG